MAVEFEYRLRCGERVYVLPRGEVLLGRDPTCQIHLEGELVSRRHARISVEPSGLCFHDLGSANGSRVNDNPVTGSVELRPGDRIRIALFRLVVEAFPRRNNSNPTLRLRYCDGCNGLVAQEMEFCPACGHRLPGADAPVRTCDHCGQVLLMGQTSCSICGRAAKPDP